MIPLIRNVKIVLLFSFLKQFGAIDIFGFLCSLHERTMPHLLQCSYYVRVHRTYLQEAHLINLDDRFIIQSFHSNISAFLLYLPPPLSLVFCKLSNRFALSEFSVLLYFSILSTGIKTYVLFYNHLIFIFIRFPFHIHYTHGII